MNSGWVAYDDVSLKLVSTYNLEYDAENRLTDVTGSATADFVYRCNGKSRGEIGVEEKAGRVSS